VIGKICLFTEELHPPFDEGYKNFTYHLFRQAAETCEVLRLGCGDPGVIDVQVHADKLLLSGDIRRAIRAFRPDAVIYVPIASATSASFIRARILRRYARGAPVAMIGLQPREYPRLLRPVLRAIAPSTIYVQAEVSRRTLEAMGINAGTIQAGVDSEKFRPVAPSEKDRLREKYGIAPESFVALHVGHISERRNLRVMADAGSIPGVRSVVVGSTSTPQDAGLAQWLRENGVLVLDVYIEGIEELYQLSDLYVFPVIESTAAIELPLSVLEAMACNLPVVATRFGGLADHFAEGEGLYLADDSEQLIEKLRLARRSPEVSTRAMVAPYTWQAVVEKLFCEMERLRSADHRDHDGIGSSHR